MAVEPGAGAAAPAEETVWRDLPRAAAYGIPAGITGRVGPYPGADAAMFGAGLPFSTFMYGSIE